MRLILRHKLPTYLANGSVPKGTLNIAKDFKKFPKGRYFDKYGHTG